eukprot:1206813-Rhodomonas_salina.1
MCLVDSIVCFLARDAVPRTDLLACCLQETRATRTNLGLLGLIPARSARMISTRGTTWRRLPLRHPSTGAGAAFQVPSILRLLLCDARC